MFILAGSIHVAMNFQRAEEVYARPERQILVPFAEWVEKEWERLPPAASIWRKARGVFVAQYAGDLEVLSQQLSAQGWTVSPRWTWRASLPYLNPNAT